ncbi:hypothetical protein CKAH01_19052 [Colletotrichum kahawae]|uniref:Uncharacterized protein n=1 Tax=Colletotrichum kahawae TaxID=34407 RepID=A0AAD9Y013_COLKA|nr:hypothetical protein CKAH01_19052 [Colletotrichum kahawae]
MLSDVASIGLAWLWFKWRRNYVWVHLHIIVPTLRTVVGDIDSYYDGDTNFPPTYHPTGTHC